MTSAVSLLFIISIVYGNVISYHFTENLFVKTRTGHKDSTLFFYFFVLCRFQHTTPFRPDLAPFFGNGFFRPPFPGLHAPVPSAATLQANQAAANPLALQPSSGMCLVGTFYLL